MNTDILKIVSNRGIPFNVRFVTKGARYGLNMCLVHDEAEPMVEFYDARQANQYFDAGLGQFVSRYYASTLLGNDKWSRRKPGDGLDLDGGIDGWEVDGNAMEIVNSWVSEKLTGTASKGLEERH